MPAPTTVLQQSMSKAGRAPMGFLVPNAAISALAAGSFTAPRFFLNDAFDNNTYRGWGVWRTGAATAADYFRHITGLTKTTGAVTIDSNWADTTSTSEDFYILPPGVVPDMIVDCFNLALRNGYFPNMEPVSLKPAGAINADAGMQNSTMASWTESDADAGAAITGSKVTTANSENVYRGIGSMRGLNAAAGGYLRQRYNVTPEQRIVVHAISRLDSGTNAELVLRDVSNSAFIGTTVEHDLEAWQFMRRIETIPDGCKILEVRLQGEGTTDDVYWNGLFVMPQGVRQMILDTRWDTAYKAEMGLKYVRLRNSSENDIFDAFGTEMIDIPPHLYDIDIETPGANPTRIFFHDGIEQYLEHPIYLHGRRAFSDLYTVAIDTMATSIPINQDLFDALFREQYFSKGDVRKMYSDWSVEYSRARDDAAAASGRMTVQNVSKKFAPSSWGRV
jgi:hypothetical protein